MSKSWTANDYQRVMMSGTACVGLLVFVLGTFWLVGKGVVGPTALGAVSGSGLLGIGSLLLQIFKVALKG